MFELLKTLGVSLSIGLLIGLERSWNQKTGTKVAIAGIRTFGLIGLLGGLSAYIAGHYTNLFLIASFLSVAVAMIIFYYRDKKGDQYYGMTTIVAAFVTFSLGVIAVIGMPLVASAFAVVTGTLLGMKSQLNKWLAKLDHNELFSVYKLLIITVVLLPILPDQHYGPWNAINPFEIWLLVVMIASISFAGYFAVKIKGTRVGIIVTSFFGGLASSTATTINFSKIGASSKTLHTLLSTGVIISSATMFPRVLLEVAIVNYSLMFSLLVPMLSMMVASYMFAYIYWKKERSKKHHESLDLKNPFELGPAIKFGLLLTLIIVLAKMLQIKYGDTGVYILSFISGVSDVDAITLTLAKMARSDINSDVATTGIIIAALVNTSMKAILVIFIAKGKMARIIGFSFTAIILIGLLSILLVQYI